jgi:hypothetical protein
MDVKEVLAKAKARIATRETWCQGTMARGEVDDSVRPGKTFFTDLEPTDPRACKWCLDGAIYAELGGERLICNHDDVRELYKRTTAFLKRCSVKHFDDNSFVSVNDGDIGVPEEVHADGSDAGVEKARELSFSNVHKLLDCAIECAAQGFDPAIDS